MLRSWNEWHVLLLSDLQSACPCNSEMEMAKNTRLSGLFLVVTHFPFEVGRFWNQSPVLVSLLPAFKAHRHRVMAANGIDKEHTEIIASSIVCLAKKENMWMKKGFSKTMMARLACAKQSKQSFWALGQMVVNILSSVDYWVRKCVKSPAVFVTPSHAFPLSFGVTFTREIQTGTKKCTHLSSSCLSILLTNIKCNVSKLFDSHHWKGKFPTTVMFLLLLFPGRISPCPNSDADNLLTSQIDLFSCPRFRLLRWGRRLRRPPNFHNCSVCLRNKIFEYFCPFPSSFAIWPHNGFSIYLSVRRWSIRRRRWPPKCRHRRPRPTRRTPPLTLGRCPNGFWGLSLNDRTIDLIG